MIWQFLQLFGSAYVDGVVRDTNAAYGAFAFVLGLLAWIFFAALGVVLSIEINVVRTKRLYPRSLLTPFTDNVDLTHADQRVYADAAAAQRHKEFQAVEVTFEHGGQNRTANRQAHLPGIDTAEAHPPGGHLDRDHLGPRTPARRRRARIPTGPTIAAGTSTSGRETSGREVVALEERQGRVGDLAASRGRR